MDTVVIVEQVTEFGAVEINVNEALVNEPSGYNVVLNVPESVNVTIAAVGGTGNFTGIDYDEIIENLTGMLTGIAGPQGEQGPSGEQGIQGEQGPQGPPGTGGGGGGGWWF